MTHSGRAVLHLVEGAPDDGAADTTLDRVHGRRSFWREPKKKLRRLLVEQRRLQRWIKVKYMYSIARQVAAGLRRVNTVRSVHREDSFQKIRGCENKNGMSTEDVNTGAKWTAHFTNWQSKRNNKAECNQSHLHHEQKFVDKCKVGAANVSSKMKKKKARAPEP